MKYSLSETIKPINTSITNTTYARVAYGLRRESPTACGASRLRLARLNNIAAGKRSAFSAFNTRNNMRA